MADYGVRLPYQIKRVQNAENPNLYDFQLWHVPSGKLVTAYYRSKCPIPDKLMRHTQAELNSRAWLDANCVY